MIADVELKNKSLIYKFRDELKEVFSEEFLAYFKRRKKLKAIINNETGEIEKIIAFADIHRHSDNSLLDGAMSVKSMATKTEACGGITDHGTMSGVFDFYKEMKAQNKIPIIGQEFYCESINGDKVSNHLILIAKNQVGYKNLCKLSSIAQDNFYYKPLISYKDLEKYHEGLICTSACIAGELSKSIITYSKSKDSNDAKKINEIVKFFKDLFKDDYYFEIQRHGIENEEYVNNALLSLGKKHGVKVIATTDSHYLNKEDREAHELLLCISTKKTFADKDRFRFNGDGYHVHTSEEMEELFSDHLECLDNTLEIAEKCEDFFIQTGTYYLPEFPYPPQFKSEMEYLRSLVTQGFIERYKPMFDIKTSDTSEIKKEKESKKIEYWKRAKYELSIIEKMGFAGYFLIVWDFLNFCLNNDIPIGPGRGSGAGSMVLYCLHITDIEPMQYGLLFERFLNPDRISMPDIDSDISQLKREQVLEYVKNKYDSADKTRVAQIITFGTLAAKSAIDYTLKLVGGYTDTQSKLVTKLIPSDPKITLKKALSSTDFAEWVKESAEHERYFKLAQTIEGLKRNASVHACGVVIAKDEITSYMPTTMAMELDEDGRPTGTKVLTTQFEGPQVEEVGCLKMDVRSVR